MPISSDSLSRKVSEPSTSSIESMAEVASRSVVRGPIEPAPEVASCSEDKGAMQPMQEATFVSGRQGNDEVEEVAISCGDLESSITSKDCTRITQEYSLEVLELTNLERPHTLQDGYMTLSERYL